MKWTIRLVPPKPRAQLAEGLSVAVTLSDGTGRPRSYLARSGQAMGFSRRRSPQSRVSPTGALMSARRPCLADGEETRSP